MIQEKPSIHVSLFGSLEWFCFQEHFGCHYILLLDRSPIKWWQRPNMAISNDMTGMQSHKSNKRFVMHRRDLFIYFFQIRLKTSSRENQHFSYVKAKAWTNFAVTAKLISTFVFATRIAHFLYFLVIFVFVQLGLSLTFSETTLMVFSRRGSVMLTLVSPGFLMF